MDEPSWVGAIRVQNIKDFPVSVVETATFEESAKHILSEDCVAEIITRIAANPDIGEDISGTGGLRRLLWSCTDEEESNGSQVIYFFHDREMPIFLIAAYAERTYSEPNEYQRENFRQLVQELLSQYGKEIYHSREA